MQWMKITPEEEITAQKQFLEVREAFNPTLRAHAPYSPEGVASPLSSPGPDLSVGDDDLMAVVEVEEVCGGVLRCSLLN